MDKNFWKPEFNIGVESIDTAHRELFELVHEILHYSSRQEDFIHEMAVENINKLRALLKETFAEEEKYMEERNYIGLENHSSLHNEFMDIIDPNLWIEVISNDYSIGSVREYVSVLAGWMTAHFIIEDQATVDMAVSRWNVNSEADVFGLLEKELNHFMVELCDLKVSVVNPVYDGAPIDDGVYYELTYDDGTEVITIASKKVMLRMAGFAMGEEPDADDECAVSCYRQMAQGVAKAVLTTINPHADYYVLNSRITDYHMFSKVFSGPGSTMGIEWETDAGNMGLVVKRP